MGGNEGFQLPDGWARRAASRRTIRVPRAIWRDPDFLRLSGPPPNAQSLWLYLIVGPPGFGVPGLFVFDQAATAAAMEWPVASMPSLLDEFLQLDLLEYDPATRVVWIQSAFETNVPEHASEVLDWRTAFLKLPPSALLDRAVGVIRAALAEKRPRFQEMFAIARGETRVLSRSMWELLRPRLAPMIFARDGHRCVYCAAGENLTVDHVFPLSRGGDCELENLATACRSCNSRKNDRTPAEWRGAAQ